MKRIDLTPKARGDMREIWHFIASDSISAADRVLAKMEVDFQTLADFPGIGHRRNELDAKYRVWRVYSYLIVYRPDTNPIQIIRVVSGYRDLTRIKL